MTDVHLTTPSFSVFVLSGDDAKTFLQGQVTVDVGKLEADSYQDNYLATAICNLKGRIDFGIWMKQDKQANISQFEIVISSDCADDFVAHVNRYGAFSKINLSEATTIYPSVINNINQEGQTQAIASFSDDKDKQDVLGWQRVSIANGNYWITAKTRGTYQPQELRLHQRGGVDYDKGCYLGQEVVARIYFKSAPKAFLHRVLVEGSAPQTGMSISDSGNVSVVNAVAVESGFEALVVARPEHLQSEQSLSLLDLPDALMKPVSRLTASN